MKVIAYVLDEGERALAHAEMTSLEDHEAFVVGQADEGAVARMRDSGVLVEEVDLESDRTQARRRGATTAGAGSAGSNLVEPPVPAPLPEGVPGTFNVMTMGPMTDDQFAAIEATGAAFAERLTTYSWAVTATNSQAASLSGLAFVAEVNRPGAADLGQEVDSASADALGEVVQSNDEVDLDPEAQPVADRVLFDLILDGSKPAADVARALATDSVEIVAITPSRLRVRLAPDSPICGDPRQVDGVAWGSPGNEPELHLDRLRPLVGLTEATEKDTTLNGHGEVIAVIDTGLDTTHPDFAGRILRSFVDGAEGPTTDPAGHGTHVAGVVLGDGTASQGAYRGVAPASQLVFFGSPSPQELLSDLPVAAADRLAAAYEAGARVANNSWGTRRGYAEYTADSYVVDDFVWNHPEMVVVFSAGNEGSDRGVGLAEGNTYSVTPPGTAKNVITVGAARSDRQSGGDAAEQWGARYPGSVILQSATAAEPVSGDPNRLAPWSGRGPAAHVIKPDVVAPGTAICSTRSSAMAIPAGAGVPGSDQYWFSSGTSMAAPAVAGLCALIRQWYVAQGVEPSAALVKATLVNGTRWLTGADTRLGQQEPPDNNQGFGEVDLRTTLPTASSPGFRVVWADTWQTPARCFARNGSAAKWTVQVKAGTPLRICLTYTDAPGRGVQNDLSMYVQPPDTTHKILANAASPDRNDHILDMDNSTEIIRIAEPVAGTWQIRVHCGALIKKPQTGQAYALVVTGDLDGDLTYVVG